MWGGTEGGRSDGQNFQVPVGGFLGQQEIHHQDGYDEVSVRRYAL